ncbi:hypothetical protein SEA_CAMBIARE_30 [Mycobacterium phage Cambiare]|uniref:Uncharacterized protein n=2 Tax=Avocadovirus TaxID=2946813 RepID=A0A222YY69_9CAUD|nr:hypothetical protein AVT48_gp30 [Mycobacterium phage Cambiare]YP_010051501.1 hypothetical protein KDW73_gp29 [Mycobacterium phage Avocado]AKF14532.1 hypothetical protein SEA_CAMBIARE_30 [Mycobacterium phage Cambiare]ASR77231.1 hypothetical protein SEA_AVOCADO_29 [Mycobacterium phage Avocado]
MAAWNGPRHRSWASDTRLSLYFAIAIVVTYVIWEIVGEAPQGMVTLVGLAGGALLGGLSGDKSKREAERAADVKDAQETAHRAEVKADRAGAVAEVEHPDTARSAGLPPTDVEGADHG